MIRKYTIIFPILQYQGVKNRARKTVVYSIIEKKTNPTDLQKSFHEFIHNFVASIEIRKSSTLFTK